MNVVTVLKDNRVRGRYLVDLNNEMEAKNLIKHIKPGYEYSAKKLMGSDDFDDGVYKMFWEDDDPNCVKCQYEFELKVEEKISVAEFNGKTYRIPEKRWPLVEKNLSYYSEKEI